MPLYALLNEYSVPLMATFSGSITPTMDASLPGRFQAVAKQFPNIPMIGGARRLALAAGNVLRRFLYPEYLPGPGPVFRPLSGAG